MNITEKLANLIDRSNGSVRLGLPAYEWWQEALHGVANSPGVNFSSAGAFSYATSFPVPLLFSAAFDDKLVLDIATVISTEARAFSNAARTGLDFFTPNINPCMRAYCSSFGTLLIFQHRQGPTLGPWTRDSRRGSTQDPELRQTALDWT